ncbi:hypothetical protein HY605_00260, partial [Candidatus Peregrinibacteria bacterium]|nr:hypothetical protein [Candidatus Peregrinibacteria bacterium]
MRIFYEDNDKKTIRAIYMDNDLVASTTTGTDPTDFKEVFAANYTINDLTTSFDSSGT